MSEWQTFCLKDLGKIVGGATPSTNNPKNYGNKIAWITRYYKPIKSYKEL